MTVHLTDAQEQRFERIAIASNRTVDEVVQEAVTHLLDAMDEHSAAIAEAEEQIRLGLTIPHEEVFARLKQRMGW